MGPEITICVCKPDYFIITLKLCLQKTRLLHYIKAVYIKTDHLNGQNIILLQQVGRECYAIHPEITMCSPGRTMAKEASVQAGPVYTRRSYGQH